MFISYVCLTRLGFLLKLMIFKVLEIQGEYQPDTSQIVPVINRNAFLIDCFKQKSLYVETILYKMKSLNKGAFYCCIILVAYYSQTVFQTITER